MKRFRLVDTPLIIKIGFAPAFALVMLACLATGEIVAADGPSPVLPASLRMRAISAL